VSKGILLYSGKTGKDAEGSLPAQENLSIVQQAERMIGVSFAAVSIYFYQIQHSLTCHQGKKENL